MGVTAAAGEFKAEGLELSGDVGVDGAAHGELIAGKEHLHAHLLEAHERTHAHAAREQHVDVVRGEVLHGSEAAALLMGTFSSVETDLILLSSISTMV